MRFTKTRKDVKKELFVAYNMFKHLDRIPTLDDLAKMGITYEADLLFGTIPWDFQWSTDQLAKRKTGDCNTINRMIQMAAITKGHVAYLVSYWPKSGLQNGHATIIIQTPEGKWSPCDYGDLEELNFNTPEEAVSHIAKQYDDEVICFVAQDWKWKFQVL